MKSENDNAVIVRIAVCIGGTNTNVAALDAAYKEIVKITISTSSGGELMDACKAAEDRIGFTRKHWEEFLPHRKKLLDELGDAIKQVAQQAGEQGYVAVGVGVSAPGAIHPITGEILGPFGGMNLPAWGNFNLKDEIRNRTGLETRVINDAKAMALGALTRMSFDTISFPDPDRAEQMIGDKGRYIRDFIEIDPGTGLGGAYVVAGEIWFGTDRDNPDPDVGEIWKLDITPDVPGSNLEEQSSGRVTVRRIEERLMTQAGEEGKQLVREADGYIQDMLRIASAEMRTLVCEELTRTGVYIGKGIRLLMTEERERLQAPDIRTFLIGGGLVSGDSEEASTVRRALYDGIRTELVEMKPFPQILFTRLGSKAGVVGSAALLE
ncbi:MAG: ROK family protein [Planctomycetota bacterium]